MSQQRANLNLDGDRQCPECYVPKPLKKFLGKHGYLVAGCDECREPKNKKQLERYNKQKHETP